MPTEESFSPPHYSAFRFNLVNVRMSKYLVYDLVIACMKWENIFYLNKEKQPRQVHVWIYECKCVYVFMSTYIPEGAAGLEQHDLTMFPRTRTRQDYVMRIAPDAHNAASNRQH